VCAADNDVMELQQGVKFEKGKVFSFTHHESVQAGCKIFRGNISVNIKINFTLSHTRQRESLELFGGGHMSLMNLNASGIETYNDRYMTFLFRSNKEKSEKEKSKDKDYETKEKKEETATQREERALQREERSYRVSKCYFVFCTMHCNIIV
jgi:hypothetical protein